MIELKIKIKQEYEKGNFKGLDVNLEKLGKNFTTAEKIVCETLEKGIEYTIDAMMEQTAEKMEELKSKGGIKTMKKRRKINLIVKNFDGIKALPGVEKEILSGWKEKDIDKLLKELKEVMEKLHNVANICINGNCNALKNLGLDDPTIDIVKMLAEII